MFQGRLQQHTNARTSSQLGLSVNSQRLLAGLAGAEPLHLAPAVVEVPDEVLDCSGPTIYHIQLIPLNLLVFHTFVRSKPQTENDCHVAHVQVRPDP